MKRLLLASALLSLLTLSLTVTARRAGADTGPSFRGLQSQAMGRTGVASSNGATALFLNPAGLEGDKGGNMGLSMDMGLNSVLIDYAAWATKYRQYLSQYDSLSQHLDEVDNKWAPFTNSLLINGRYDDIAFALLYDTHYDLAVTKAPLTPVLGAGGIGDVVLTAGRGFEGPDGYHFGVALKYIYRLRFEDRYMGTGDEAFYKVLSTLRAPNTGIWSQLAKVEVASEIAQTQQGVGMNLGVEKAVTDNWTGGLSLIDFPTLIGSHLIKPDVDLGLAYHRDVDLLPGLDNRVLANVDFQRFLTPGTPWWHQLKVGAALEGYVNKRQVAYIALGLNDGYPTFGISLGYIAYLSYVYVAEEVGTYPGQQMLSFHKLCLSLNI
jgi:hypothetical protein